MKRCKKCIHRINEQKAESDDPIRLFYEGGVTGPKTGDMKKFKAFASCLVQFEYTIDL